VVKYYDVLRDLNIRDRRWMPRDFGGALRTTSIVTDRDPASVQLVTFGGVNDTEIPVKEHKDELLYVLSGEVEIEIRETSGRFTAEEFIFLPHVVPYRVKLLNAAALLFIKFEPPHQTHITPATTAG
jgi:mannose-6-phosphate isomerase-like protein (cupin superfamily)